jgi:hypothetical protein
VPSRVQPLVLLTREGTLPVKEIAEALRMTAPAVSRRLGILRTARLVNAWRRGYWGPYPVSASVLSDCCGVWVRIGACPDCGGEGKSPAASCGAAKGETYGSDRSRSSRHSSMCRSITAGETSHTRYDARSCPFVALGIVFDVARLIPDGSPVARVHGKPIPL